MDIHGINFPGFLVLSGACTRQKLDSRFDFFSLRGYFGPREHIATGAPPPARPGSWGWVQRCVAGANSFLVPSAFGRPPPVYCGLLRKRPGWHLRPPLAMGEPNFVSTLTATCIVLECYRLSINLF